MPLVQMPDGQYVEIEEGTPPEVVARIKAQFRAKKPAAATAPQSVAKSAALAQSTAKEVDKLVERRRKIDDYIPSFMGLNPRRVNAATFGLADKGRAAVDAALDTVMGDGKRSFSENYALNRDAAQQLRQTESEEKPWSSTFDDIVGSLMNPVGASTGAGRAAMAIAPKATTALNASRLGQIMGRLGNTSVGLGARTGVNYGVLQGAANTFDDPNQSLMAGISDSAITGAGSGALFGGAVGAAGKVGSILADRMPENAKRVAYSKMADFLSRSHDPATGKPFTIASAQNEIKATDRAGGDAMLMDIAPEMRNMAGYLSRKPAFKEAAELEARAVQRSMGAADRFDNAVRKSLKYGDDVDAVAAKESVSAARKAQGAEDYAAGGAMDKPLKWSNELDKYMREAPPATEVALRTAYLERLNRREMPAQLHKGPDGTFTHVPDLRTLDYVKRAFDNGIGQALRSGDRATAGALSQELNTLKKLIADSNPEYSEILARQRNMFEKENALQLGMNALKRLKSNPRELLRDMRKNGTDYESLRLGFADALLSLREKGENPVQLMRAMMRSNNQRKVLRYIFGDNKTLNQFDKFIRREIRSRDSDNMVISNRQSATHVFDALQRGDEIETAGQLGRDILQGAAFGGKMGALSRGWRSVDLLSSGVGPRAQEELARILMSKGKGLEEGTQAAKRFMERRERRRVSRAQYGARAGASLFVPDLTE